MTIDDIVARLTTGVMRDDLVAQYPNFINEALVEIQRRRSWLAMKQSDQFTIQVNSSTVSLLVADNNTTYAFKELTKAQSPISLLGTDSIQTPCNVWTKEKVIRRQSRLISNSLLYALYLNPANTRRISVPVWIEWNNENPVLNVLFPAITPLPFMVSFFAYMPPLVAGQNPAQSNYLTTYYPEMVVNKAKSIAFSSINDPATADFETLFEKKFAEAAAQDAYQALAGLELRM